MYNRHKGKGVVLLGSSTYHARRRGMQMEEYIPREGGLLCLACVCLGMSCLRLSSLACCVFLILSYRVLSCIWQQEKMRIMHERDMSKQTQLYFAKEVRSFLVFSCLCLLCLSFATLHILCLHYYILFVIFAIRKNIVACKKMRSWA